MEKTKLKLNFEKKGVGIIEVVVAAGIISIALAGIASLGNFSLRIQSSLRQNLLATNLAIEAIEATKAVKSEDWANVGALPLNTAFHPEKAGTPLKWILVQGSETIQGFTRHIMFGRVLRDADDNIVESGGVPDQETLKAKVTVSWNDRGIPRQVSLDSYLANWQP